MPDQIESKTILKSYFVTGAVPTQQQFANLITTLVAEGGSTGSLNGAIQVGPNAFATAEGAVAIGSNVIASNVSSMIIGSDATNNEQNSLQVGNGIRILETDPTVLRNGDIWLGNDSNVYARSNDISLNLSSGSASVTEISAGNGMSFTTITTLGPVTLGTPSTCSNVTSNTVTSTSHTHAITGFVEQKGVETLMYAANVNTDATTANIFRVTLTGAVLLKNPTGGYDGQALTWWVKQGGGGSNAVTLDTDFNLPASASPLVWSTVVGRVDILAARYDAAESKWYVVAFVPGYNS